MTIQELAQAALDARASLVTSLGQARVADDAAKAAADVASQVHVNVAQLDALYQSAKDALFAAFTEPLEP